ncbi:hypothetical protein GJAV_G00164190 [Gymnothorax javanicus]|nr:hypothetical protein GJAV_G00164190 [Gymnothorax javanicus]
METENALQEVEERLILAPLNADHQTENLTSQLQNGNQLSEKLLQQNNGDVSWNHFKPNEGFDQENSHEEKCSNPLMMQDLLDQNLHLRNRGIKHQLNEPSLLRFHQSKKLKLDLEINGQDDGVAQREIEKCDSMPSKPNFLPELSDPSALESDGLQKQKLDNKCNFANEDLCSLTRNTKLAFINGAIVNSPSMEDVHSVLLEKTLSQYYPDHISVASQNPSTNDSSMTPASSEKPEETSDSPKVTSGLPVSSQDSLSREQERISSGDCNGNSDPSFATDEEQPGQILPPKDTQAALGPCSHIEEGPQLVDPSDSSNSQNITEGSLKALTKSMHSDEESSENPSFRSQLQTEDKERIISLKDNIMAPVVGDKDTEISDLSDVLNPNLNAQGGPDIVQADIDQQALEGTNNQELNNGALDHKLENHSIESHAKDKNETEEHLTFQMEADNILQQTDPYPEVNCSDLDSSLPPKELSLPQPQLEMQADVQSHGQMQNLGPIQGFQKQDSNQSSSQQQEKHKLNLYKPELASDQISNSTEPEWQNLHPEPSQIQTPHKELKQSNESQPVFQQRAVPQHQVGNNQFHSETQNELSLKDTQNIEQTQKYGYSQQHPAPTLQSEGQIGTNALQHYPSLNLEGMTEPTDQVEDPSRRQLNCQALNRIKPEEGMRLEGELKSSNCNPQNQQTQHQIGLNPTARTSPSFVGSSVPSFKLQQGAMFSYSQSDVCMRDGMLFQSTVTQKQNSQHRQVQSQMDHKESQQLPLKLIHQSSMVPHGACNQQPSMRMFPQSELQKMSRTQLQQGQLQNQNHQEFQRHAALRMHLLQKQEKQGQQQNLLEFKQILQAIEHERVSRAEPQHGKEPTLIKEEHSQMTCQQTQHKSIIATMEQQLRRYQLSPVFERKSLGLKTPQKIKVETSGPVTILTTNADLGGEEFGATTQLNSTSEVTPTKKMESNLNSFLESPLKLLDTPIKNLLDTPVKTQYEIPPCHCVEQISEKDEGPYYTHLGAAPNVAGIRELMETRFGQSGDCLRIEKIVYTGKEGKSALGCPIAKWVIRRASEEEKVLVLVRERAGHTCETAVIVVVIIIWEGIPASLADQLYTDLRETLQRYGALTNRRCAFNEERTCACQGLDPDTCGASFSFGCSWSMYYNGCKFARSKIPRKFRLLGDDHKEEEKMEQHLQNLATLVAPRYKQMAPAAYANQVEYEHRAPDCRLGLKDGRPFSGVTACLDFCAHAHRDLHNMPSGSTVVCTLTREDNREIGKIPEDEQLHVLPLYKIAATDEFGSAEGQQEKMKSGAIQVLSTYRRKVRMLAEPAKSCRQRNLEAKRGGSSKDTPNSKTDKAPPAALKQSTLETPGQNVDVSGSQPAQNRMEAAQLGNTPHPFNTQYQQQQQERPPITIPGSPHQTQQNYSRFPSPEIQFSNISQSTLCPQSPALMSPHPSPLHPNAYINGSNPLNLYHGSLDPNSSYPGYPCTGSITMDSFHPYYASSQRHMNTYPHQRTTLCSEQQYHPHQHYKVDYTPQYSDIPHVNGNNNCKMEPDVHHMGTNVHTMGPYSTPGLNNGPDSKLLEAIARPPSAHPTMDCAAPSKGSEYNTYSNLCLSQNPQMYIQDKDPFHLHMKTEMNFHNVNCIGQVLPPMGTEYSTPIQPGQGLPNENTQGTPVKQEGCLEAQTPTHKEEVWSDNVHSFLDPEIGGVAVAPSHGSILIECAKRELHATTPLKNPDRNHPTRISLVFYQHKNMIEAKHGLALWEAKMAEKAREKEEEIEKYGVEGTPTKKKKIKREPPEFLENAELSHKRFFQTPSAKASSCTTNTYISTSPYAYTKVTGPYNHLV